MKAVVMQVVKCGFVLQQTAQHLLIDPDIFHESQLTDQVRHAVEAVQVGNNIGEAIQERRIGAITDLFITLLAGVKHELIKTVVPVLHRLFLGLDQLEHVITINAAFDLDFPEKDPLQNFTGGGDIIPLFIVLEVATLLEHFVQSVKERARNLVANRKGLESCQAGVVQVADFTL